MAADYTINAVTIASPARIRFPELLPVSTVDIQASVPRFEGSVAPIPHPNFMGGGSGGGVCPPCPPTDVRPTIGLLYPRRTG
jgi:hypothetical protein